MNKVMLIGNVGKDPDIHYFEADRAVARSLSQLQRKDILCLMVPKCQTIQIGTILFFIVGLQR